MVPPVVPELELVRGPSERGSQQLVAEADTEHGDVAEQAPDGIDRVRHGGRIAGSVGQEDAVGSPVEHCFGRGRRGHDLDRGDLPKEAEDAGLDAEVVGDDLDGAALDHIRLGRRHGGDEVDAVRAGLGQRRLLQRAFIMRSAGGRHTNWAEGARHRARLPDVTREAAGVDARDTGHTVPHQPATQIFGCPPAAGAPGQVADDDAPTEGPAALVIGAGHAVVADVRVGERDHLAGVRRVGDDLLVTRKNGVEDDLAGGDAARRLGTDGLTLECRPVGEHDQRFP